MWFYIRYEICKMHTVLSLPMNIPFRAGLSKNVRASLNKSHIITEVNILITPVVASY
jgi:hypothetical protein